MGITTIGAKPSARNSHVGFFDSGRFCIHGGHDGSRVDDLWCITPEAVTCASTTHDCQDGFERDTDKDGTACAADACTDTECCKAWTQIVPSGTTTSTTTTEK